MTIGDVLAVIAAIIITVFTWGAMILLATLLFSGRAVVAAQECVTRPWVSFFRGFGITLAIGIFIVIEIQNGMGPFRLIAAFIGGFGAILAAIGSAGIVRICASRISPDYEKSPETAYTTLVRATAIYVGSGLFPVLGWFCVLPILTVFSIGAGAGALFPSKPKQIQSTVPAAPALEANL